MFDRFVAWADDILFYAELVLLGAFLYATLKYQAAAEKPGVGGYLLDVVVAAACGTIFMASAAAVGLTGMQVGAVGGIAGYMGPPGMRSIGDAVLRIIEKRSK